MAARLLFGEIKCEDCGREIEPQFSILLVDGYQTFCVLCSMQTKRDYVRQKVLFRDIRQLPGDIRDYLKSRNIKYNTTRIGKAILDGIPVIGVEDDP